MLEISQLRDQDRKGTWHFRCHSDSFAMDFDC
jgi:hypothetical protein